MIPEEIKKQIKRIEISTRKLVNESFAGEYHSIFKGRGIEFSEIREYTIGDDVRFIDWNVVAKTNQPFIKVFDEERELNLMLVVDVSASNFFTTSSKNKLQIAVEICSVLSFSALNNNDKVGLLLFSDRVEKYIPCKRGKRHILRIIREILTYEPSPRKTNINNILSYITKTLKRKSVIFLLSDFFADDYYKSLKILNKKHDLTTITLYDPRELKMFNSDLIYLQDIETGEILLVDTSNKKVLNQFNTLSQKHYSELQTNFKKFKINNILIDINKPYITELHKYFKKRN